MSQVAACTCKIEELCRRFGVPRLELLGSAAAGDFLAQASYLEFLVEFQQPSGPGYADRYLGFMEALQELFGRRVDLVAASAISDRYFRQVVGTKGASLCGLSARSSSLT